MKYLDWLWRLPFVWLIKIIATIFAPLIGRLERTAYE